MKASKFEENNNSAKRDSAKSENSDKWLNLEVNKMTFYISTLDEKYQNGNLDVQDSQLYYLFICKMAESHVNLNAKTGKWKKFAEFLKFVWTSHVQS